MKTIRRDWLRRQVEAGKVTMVGSYHFDDMYGSDRTSGTTLPVAMNPGDWHLRKEGVCYLWDGDFKSSCGRAWRNENGTITLYVHSNCNYTLRVAA